MKIRARFFYTDEAAQVTLRDKNALIPNINGDEGAAAFVRINGRTVSGDVYQDDYHGFDYIFVARGANRNLAPGANSYQANALLSRRAA